MTKCSFLVFVIFQISQYPFTFSAFPAFPPLGVNERVCQDQNWDWTDKTEDNFNNFAKNCTGREHEPECAPEEKAQQWYDWEGHDLGTYLCKKPAKKPNDLFVTTPEYLLRVDLRSALPLESPQTLRLAENNRTLDLPLAVGSRKPLADLADIPLSIGAVGAKGAFKPLSAWR